MATCGTWSGWRKMPNLLYVIASYSAVRNIADRWMTKERPTFIDWIAANPLAADVTPSVKKIDVEKVAATLAAVFGALNCL